MDATILNITAWSMALSSGVMAGVYFSFSGFIMRAFDSLDTHSAIDAMNAVNRIIVQSLFMPLFFGSTLLAAVMIAIALTHWGAPGSAAAASAGSTYVLGMFGLTAARNVPLNNALAQFQGNDAQASTAWRRYCRQWTRWNTLRAIACLATMSLSIGLAIS